MTTKAPRTAVPATSVASLFKKFIELGVCFDGLFKTCKNVKVGQKGWNTRIITVIMKPVPNANATSLNRFFSITMFPEYPVEEDSSSEVIRRIIAVTASHRLTSDIDNGKFIF